jgi:argininosuccinate lyase
MTYIRGRFQKEADDLVLNYTESISFDWRLYREIGKYGIAVIRPGN